MATMEMDVELSSLTPIQSQGVSLSHIALLGTSYEPGPVKVVALPSELNLLVDGTHRAYRAHLLGEKTIRAEGLL